MSFILSSSLEITIALGGVAIGSIITIFETADASRSIELEVTVVDTAPVGYTNYSVDLITVGSKAIRTGTTATKEAAESKSLKLIVR